MVSDFDLALALLRPNPDGNALKRGLDHLVAELVSTDAFEGDLFALWSPEMSFDVEDPTPLPDWSLVKAISPIWLSRMARPAAAENTLEGILYQIYCRCLDDPSLLAAKELSFFYNKSNAPNALGLSLDLLTLRHLPCRFLPEILGVTLADTSLQLAGIRPPENRRSLARAALEEALMQGHDPVRIRKGFALYHSAAVTVFSGTKEMAPSQTQRDAFAHIVAAKVSGAKGYHANVRLQNQALDTWFETHAEDPAEILRALEKSPLVDQACPLGSRLIKAMEFGGPMFGVFDAHERVLAGRWIADPEQLTRQKVEPKQTGLKPNWRTEETAPPLPKPQGIRDLFYRLVLAENMTEVPHEAEHLILRILRRTQRLQNIGFLPMAFVYQPSELDEFLDARHAAALRPPKKSIFSPKLSRAKWRWILTQLAPAVLVDGAWLFGVAAPPSQLQPWHLELIKIHEDELGQGQPAQNHPLIYRRLLESLSVDFPAIADASFAKDKRILTSAFTFPSLMVAIGWHYNAFEPECLGLNLAIELSGLGSGYQRVIRSMKEAGIDPLIAELHLSIDNLASGHARRARNAIVLYLEFVARNEGVAAQQKTWERIYRGFLSYRVALAGIGFNMLMRSLNPPNAFTR